MQNYAVNSIWKHIIVRCHKMLSTTSMVFHQTDFDPDIIFWFKMQIVSFWAVKVQDLAALLASHFCDSKAIRRVSRKAAAHQHLSCAAKQTCSQLTS